MKLSVAWNTCKTGEYKRRNYFSETGFAVPCASASIQAEEQYFLFEIQSLCAMEVEQFYMLIILAFQYIRNNKGQVISVDGLF